MNKKLGEIDFDDSEFINNSLSDMYGEDPDNVDPLDAMSNDHTKYNADTLEDTGNVNHEDTTAEDDASGNVEDDSNTDKSESDKDDSYFSNNSVETDDNVEFRDYSDLALIAMSLKEQDPEIINFDISKDLSAEDFITNVKTNINKVKSDLETSVEERYGEAAKYLKMIIDGSSQEEVQTVLGLSQIANMEITGYEDDDVLEDVVRSWLNLKNSPDVDDLIDIYKDKGILEEKARDSVAFHKEQENLYLDNLRLQRQEEAQQIKQQHERYYSTVSQIINKGQISGLPIKDKKKLQDSLFKNTEVIEYLDDRGNKQLTKVPLIQVKMNALQQDLEKQLALQMLILDDFDFTTISQKAERKVNNNLIDILNERTTKPRKKGSTYFDE